MCAPHLRAGSDGVMVGVLRVWVTMIKLLYLCRKLIAMIDLKTLPYLVYILWASAIVVALLIWYKGHHVSCYIIPALIVVGGAFILASKKYVEGTDKSDKKRNELQSQSDNA